MFPSPLRGEGQGEASHVISQDLCMFPSPHSREGQGEASQALVSSLRSTSLYAGSHLRCIHSPPAESIDASPASRNVKQFQLSKH